MVRKKSEYRKDGSLIIPHPSYGYVVFDFKELTVRKKETLEYLSNIAYGK